VAAVEGDKFFGKFQVLSDNLDDDAEFVRPNTELMAFNRDIRNQLVPQIPLVVPAPAGICELGFSPAGGFLNLTSAGCPERTSRALLYRM